MLSLAQGSSCVMFKEDQIHYTVNLLDNLIKLLSTTKHPMCMYVCIYTNAHI